MKKTFINIFVGLIPNKKNRHKIRQYFLDDKQEVLSLPYIMGKDSYCFAKRVAEGTSIGKYCSIADGVWIHPPEHMITGLSSCPHIPGHVEDNEKGKSKGCKIENDVWIGLNAIILQSCKSIGNGAVVAAGAVVNRSVPPYAIVGGIPAKIIKYRFAEDIRDKLLQSKWWELADETLENMQIDDVSKFLSGLDALVLKNGISNIKQGDNYEK